MSYHFYSKDCFQQIRQNMDYSANFEFSDIILNQFWRKISLNTKWQLFRCPNQCTKNWYSCSMRNPEIPQCFALCCSKCKQRWYTSTSLHQLSFTIKAFFKEIIISTTCSKMSQWHNSPSTIEKILLQQLTYDNQGLQATF